MKYLSRAFCVGINLNTLAASSEFLAKLSVLPDLGVDDLIPLLESLRNIDINIFNININYK